MTRRVVGATCHLPPATCHLPPATCHLPPATCRLPPATCHLPLATKGDSQCSTSNGCVKTGKRWPRPCAS
ncbi:MAG: hypothetical protein DWI57_00655 [Chloroflexi bacterium]|nr:MAG: hypothetical protein DWI57_00655 [Chloroflexota bacterium]